MVTLAGYCLLLAGRLMLFPFRIAREEWRSCLVRQWARACAQIAGLDIVVRGSIPDPPRLLVCNHLSYVDIPLLFTQVGATFVAKTELQSWPVLGFLIKSASTVFIDRTRKRDIPRVNALIEHSIRQNRLVIVFPEGTSSRGQDVLPFKPSLLEYAAQNQSPVMYATIHYSTSEPDPPADMAVCWWGDMTFPGHIFNLLKLRRIRATVDFGKSPVRGTDRKELAQALRELMKQQFVPSSVKRDEDAPQQPEP